MNGEHVTRRRVLRAVGLGATTVGMFGTAAAQPPDAYIVGVRDASAVQTVRGRADAVRHVIDLGAYGTAVAGRFSARAVEALQGHTAVTYVERDGTMHAIGRGPGAKAPGGTPGPPDNGGGGGGGGGGSPSQCLPWGVDRVDADVATANGNDGSGADVAILDTGIDADHPDLEGNLGSGTAFVKCRGGSCLADWDDDNGHGTHCAGIVAAVDNGEGVRGAAPAATLHAVKVLDKRGSGSYSDIAAGIDHVVQQGWDVISMSLGGSADSQTLRRACQNAADSGVLLVAAAGNSGPCTDCVGYPAKYDSVVAVGSTTTGDELSSFSSTGPEVEIAAPGSAVFSTYPDGSYETLSGTSMACPHVSGAAAVLMAGGGSNTHARDTLVTSAEDIGLSASEGGAGLLDVAAAVGLVSDDDGTGTC